MKVIFLYFLATIFFLFCFDIRSNLCEFTTISTLHEKWNDNICIVMLSQPTPQDENMGFICLG